MKWHVAPTNDLYPHTDSAACPCMPEILDGGNMVAHRSWDRREDHEGDLPIEWVEWTGEAVN